MSLKVKERWLLDPSLMLYLPLYELDGAKFMDRSAYGRLCSKTGALWRPDGNYFDGVDDFIDCAVDNLPSGTTELTVIIWLNTTHGGGQFAFTYGSDVANQMLYLTIYGGKPLFGIAGGNPNVYGSLGYDDGAWHFLGGVNRRVGANNNLRLVVDGQYVDDDNTAAQNLNTNNLYVGRTSGGAYFHDLIGEVLLLRRPLANVELYTIYEQTKWRYQ